MVIIVVRFPLDPFTVLIDAGLYSQAATASACNKLPYLMALMVPYQGAVIEMVVTAEIDLHARPSQLAQNRSLSCG